MKTYIVDSFTDQAFKGNPAGVCIVVEDLKEEKMLLIAKELGLSETAFIKKLDKENEFSIRFFSPKMEIPLCGHATLASAKILFNNHLFSTVHFKNIDGLILTAKLDDGAITLEFPRYSTESSNVPPKLLEALGINDIINCEYNAETKILLVEISDPEQLKNLTPDFYQLKDSHNSINGVLVTASSKDANHDFYSRYFWPWSGTNEDPVTGGTHTFLTPYWASRLNKTKMKSFQSSERSGFMEVELLENTVKIKSKAVIVFEGHLSYE